MKLIKKALAKKVEAEVTWDKALGVIKDNIKKLEQASGDPNKAKRATRLLYISLDLVVDELLGLGDVADKIAPLIRQIK